MVQIGHRIVPRIRKTTQILFVASSGTILGISGALCFENKLPKRFKIKIDDWKTQILTNEVFEEHSIFFEDNSANTTILELKKICFEKLVDHVFQNGRTVEFYEAFFQTYGVGISGSGIKRIAKLAIQCELPLNFVTALNSVYGENEASIEPEELKNRISDLLNDVDISNECIGYLKSSFLEKLKTIDRLEETEDDELDVGRPIVKMDRIPISRQLQELIKIITKIFDSDDFLVQKRLLDRGLVDLIDHVASVNADLSTDVFNIIAQISSTPDLIPSNCFKSRILLHAIKGLISPSVEIRSASFKILNNCTNPEHLIGKNTYIGYPRLANRNHDFNIIYVHGLLGKSHRTWRANDEIIGSEGHSYCWPIEWLPRTLEMPKRVTNTDFRSLRPRVILLSYPTSLSLYGRECVDQEVTIEKRASNLIKDLTMLDLKKPTIFVGHSMGGLIIKSIILQASNNSNISDLISNLKGVVFYSTPHFGSRLASAASAPVVKNVLLPTPDVTSLRKVELEGDSKTNYLKQLNSNFLNLVQDRGLAVLSFYEQLPTKTPLKEFFIVEQSSADPGFGDVIGVHENHINVNKPTHRSDSAYSSFVNFILKVL